MSEIDHNATFPDLRGVPIRDHEDIDNEGAFYVDGRWDERTNKWSSIYTLELIIGRAYLEDRETRVSYVDIHGDEAWENSCRLDWYVADGLGESDRPVGFSKLSVARLVTRDDPEFMRIVTWLRAQVLMGNKSATSLDVVNEHLGELT